MEENNNKVSVKINKIWIFIGILVVITIVANLYVMTNNKTQSSEDRNFETGKNENAVSTRVEKIDETSESFNSTSNNIIENNNEAKTYTYSSVKGLYKGTAKDNFESNDDRNYELYLYEDGTFSYSNFVSFESGVTGNYIIVDASIILNYLFTTGNDPAMGATEGQKLLKINEDGIITDSNPINSNSNNLVLKKTSDNNEYKNGINYQIAYDNNYLYNKTNSDNDMSESPYFAKKVEIPESIYTKVKGIYKGIAKDKYDKNNNREYELYLHENGTFSYVSGVHFEGGVTGNYIIVDDTIYLNYLFATGSDASLDATEGKKELKINEDGSIADANPEETIESNLVLKKSSTNIENEDYNINYMINNYNIYNHASSEE